MSETDTTVRVGGVPEHFNLPWLSAIERASFDDLGVTVEWIDSPGGTGAIMSALAEGEIDMATPLTEGAITAIANGNPSKLVSMWVESPLLWGVHVAGSSKAQTIDDVQGQRFAISRFGSGSELMTRVLADDLGWELTDDSWVPVGNLDGALAALPNGEAEVFLWNLSMTQPHVTDGTFKRVGVLPTPWPSFAVAASDTFLRDDAGLAATIARIARHEASIVKGWDDLDRVVEQRYELGDGGATEWASTILWTDIDAAIDLDVVGSIAQRMHRLGRIESLPTQATDLVS